MLKLAPGAVGIPEGALVRRAIWWLGAVFAGLACCFEASAAPVVVEAFSPQGTVKAPRQVAVRFSGPVVRFGDPRLADPFLVNCPAAGRARWADGRNWIYDFAEDLPAGLRCEFTLKPDFKTASGATIGGKKVFRFSTGGPAVRAALPRDGSEDIDESQAFLLALDAPATEESVSAHAYCKVSGIEEKIPLQVITGDERAKLLAQREQLGYEYFRILWKDGDESVVQAKGRSAQAAEKLVVAARCARPLPPATEVQVVWGAGIATVNGVATDQDQSHDFQTRPAFTASFSCQRDCQ